MTGHFHGAHCSHGDQQQQAQGASGQLQQPHKPQGQELVTICSEANRNYRLTSRDDGVVLAYKNKQDPKQFWVKKDVGDKFVDQEGSRGFVLINSATGQALSHGIEAGSAVTQELYNANAVDNSVLWSQGRDEGHGFRTIRSVTNITLNLDADHGDKKHGGIKEGNRLVIHNWNKQENQKWILAAVGPEDD